MLGLTYDYGLTTNNGNVLSQRIEAPGLDRTQSYGYDELNRLHTASESASWSQTYGYDRYGNQWVIDSTVPLQEVTPTGTPTGSNRFNATNNRIVLPFSDYDAAGNQKKAGGGTFEFDAENRQKQVTIDMLPGNVFTYSYDGDGRRVKRLVAGITRIYVYNTLGQMIAEYRGGASPSKEFIYLGGKLLAEEAPTTGTSYVTADHLGSTRVVTDGSGAVHSRHDYLPFGKEVPIDFGGRASVAGYGAEERILQRFTAKELDPETGLEYFGARYYSGRQGRFTSTDPVILDKGRFGDPQQWNLYAYTRNNPLKFVDPTGRILEIAGDEEERRRALEALRLTLRREDRNKVRVIKGTGRHGLTKGKFFIDPAAINVGKESKDPNFQALRQVVNSPGMGRLEIVGPDEQFSFRNAQTGATAMMTFAQLNPGVTQEQIDRGENAITGITFPTQASLSFADIGTFVSPEFGLTISLVSGQIQNQETLVVTVAHEVYGHMLNAFLGGGRQVTHYVRGDAFDQHLGQIEKRTRENLKR